jgi:hypothetical protein
MPYTPIVIPTKVASSPLGRSRACKLNIGKMRNSPSILRAKIPDKDKDERSSDEFIRKDYINGLSR